MHGSAALAISRFALSGFVQHLRATPLRATPLIRALRVRVQWRTRHGDFNHHFTASSVLFRVGKLGETLAP